MAKVLILLQETLFKTSEFLVLFATKKSENISFVSKGAEVGVMRGTHGGGGVVKIVSGGSGFYEGAMGKEA